MDEKFKTNWTGRAFSLDLVETSIDFNDNTMSSESILAMTILHQSINGNSQYRKFKEEFEASLCIDSLQISDITLEAVLDHVIIEASPSSSLPRVVLFHVSETNMLLKSEPYDRLQDLMLATHNFNKASAAHGRFLLIVTFDGSYRAELLSAFETSGLTCSMSNLLPTTTDTYTKVLQNLAKKAGNVDLQTFMPPEPLQSAFKDCGSNMRMFSLLLYAIGRYNDSSRCFSWGNFFTQLKASNNVNAVENWLQSVRDHIQQDFSKYTEIMESFESVTLLHIIVHVLLEKPTKSRTAVVAKTKLTWQDLEKDGLISLYGSGRRYVDMPFLFIQIYLKVINNNSDTVFRFIDTVFKLRESRGFRQNEKCDAAVLAMHFIHFSLENPNRIDLRLNEIFKFNGDAASTKVLIPDAIQHLVLDESLMTTLEHRIDLVANTEEKIYVGTGNDPSGDVFFPLKVSQRGVSKTRLTIIIESKQRKSNATLTREYINEHKQKVFIFHLFIPIPSGIILFLLNCRVFDIGPKAVSESSGSLHYGRRHDA